MTRLATLLVLGLLALGACAQTPRNLVVLLPDDDGVVGEVEVRSARGTRVLAQAGEAAQVDNPARAVAPVGAPQLDQIFGKARTALPPSAAKFVLYFDSGETELTDDSAAAFPAISREIKARPAPRVAVVGHTDTAGDEAFNARLARERAEQVGSLLVEAGIDAAIVEVTSHGENNPLILTPDGVAEPRNRRVEVFVR